MDLSFDLRLKGFIRFHCNCALFPLKLLPIR